MINATKENSGNNTVKYDKRESKDGQIYQAEFDIKVASENIE